jgi:hypothetical protein
VAERNNISIRGLNIKHFVTTLFFTLSFYSKYDRLVWQFASVIHSLRRQLQRLE